MNILGVKIQDNLSMEKHTRDLVTSANQNLYALKILKAHGLPISSIYNWIADYLRNRSHCTKVNGIISAPLSINASVVQDSAIGPLAFILNASDLRTSTPGNKLHKYADDTYMYLVVPANNSHTIVGELAQIAPWTNAKNLKSVKS